MADVFVAYAREDQEFVRKLQDALEEHDRNIWIDWQDIPSKLTGGRRFVAASIAPTASSS